MQTLTKTSSLAEQQQAMLLALYQPRLTDAIETIAAHARGDCTTGQKHLKRGLQAYRSNGHALAQRVLAAAFPAVAALLGEDNFAALSRQFWQAQPPKRGDMAQWGAGFSVFLSTFEDLMNEEAYIVDVASVEWALHEAATQADGVADMASFALLEKIDASALTLRLSPGTLVFESVFPVVSIIQAQLTGEVSLQQAGKYLHEGRQENAVVWRQGLKPSLRLALPGETVFIKALQEKRSLSDSLEAAVGLDFSQWLLPAVQTGLLLGTYAL